MDTDTKKNRKTIFTGKDFFFSATNKRRETLDIPHKIKDFLPSSLYVHLIDSNQSTPIIYSIHIELFLSR
jgi:hypothetical protein